MSYTVLFITTSDLSGRSGHNIATNEIVQSFLDASDINLVLVCPKPKFKISDNILQKVHHIEYFNVFIPIFPISTILTQFLVLLKLLKIIKRKNQTISFIVARLGSFYFSTIFIKKKSKLPYFLLIRGLSNFRELHSIKFFNKIEKILTIQNIKLADKIYVAYEAIKQTCSKYTNSNKIEIFYNAVNPSMFNPISKGDARGTINQGIETNEFIIGFIGSIQDRHHILELILAVENIYKEKNDRITKKIRILIVGTGPNLKSLKDYVLKSSNLINKTVVFTGFINHNSISEYICACDILYGVVSPETISNPIKCYEYLAASRPIITSNIRDFEFVNNIKCGYTLNKLTPIEISKTILYFYQKTDQELYDMGNRGREYVLNNHNWSKLPESILVEFKNNDLNHEDL